MHSQLPKKKKRAFNGIPTKQIWHSPHIPLCYFRIKKTRKLSMIKISCRLADYNVKKGQQTALSPQEFLEHPSKKPSGLLALKPPIEPFAIAEEHVNVLLLETKKKKKERWSSANLGPQQHPSPST